MLGPKGQKGNRFRLNWSDSVSALVLKELTQMKHSARIHRYVGVSLLILSIHAAVPMNVPAAPGDLDTTFGNGGKVTDGPGIIYSVAMQEDGKIVTAGESGYSIVIARYDLNGSPDVTFGSGGKVVSSFGGYLINPSASIAIQPDGKIVVALGLDSDTEGNESDVLVRYNANGSLDTTFGANGIVGLPSYTPFFALAIQPDGKIVVSGGGFTIVRYNPDGSFDGTLGGDGIVSTNLNGSYDSAYSIGIQTDGKIIAAGRGLGKGGESSYDFAVIRYNTDGSLDSTFDSDGIVTTNLGLYDQAHSQVFSISLQSDGKIVAAGHSYNGSSYDWAVVRYKPDGSLDDTFDSDGKVITPIPSIYYNGNNSVAVLNTGKIIVSGTSYHNVSTKHDFTLAQYNTDGSLDTNFGGDDGIATVDFGNSSEVANGMALDRHGRAVVVGSSDEAFATARILLSGSVTVSGRVVTTDGNGLRNATVSLTDSNGARRTALTSSLGYYSFDSVGIGRTYAINVQSRRYRFSPNQLQINESLTEVNFIAIE
jgi:uncharacterized delta-60 repeat protein